MNGGLQQLCSNHGFSADQMRNLLLAFEVLSPSGRSRFFWVLGLSLIAMAFEILGIAMVMPLFDLIVKPQSMIDFPLIGKSISHFEKEANALLLAAVFVVFLFAFKNLFLAFQVKVQSRYAFGIQVEASTHLFNHYLKQPYKFFLKTNTSELLRNAIGEVNSFVGYVLQPSLVVITESLVLFAIIGYLIYIEPLASILAFVFIGGVGLAFHQFTKVRVAGWGKERQHREGMKIKCLQEGFTGIKAIKLLEDHAFLSETFRAHSQLGAIAGRNQYAMQQMPRLLLETLAIMSLASLAIASVYLEEEYNNTLPKLGMIAFGLVRLMPSVARIVHSSQSIVYGWPCVKVLKEEIGDWVSESLEPIKKTKCSFDESFEMNEVSFAYTEGSINSLTKATIKIRKGLSVGLIGESGSGKSTLVDIALGLLEPDEGEILVDGKRVGQEVSSSSWRGMVGYVPQEIFMADDTLLNNIALGSNPQTINRDKVWQCIEEASLASVVKTMPLGLDTVMGERGTRFSGGQRQRVGIARALYHDPRFIVFDEATSSLDSETECNIMDTVQDLQKTKTFLIVAHRLSTLKNCDIIYKVKGGRVIKCSSYAEMIEAEVT